VTGKPKGPRRRQVRLEVPASLSASYANFVMISHSASEVVLDFAQIMPNIPKARVQTRVVLTPTNARLLYNALGENLTNYENKFGAIRTPPTLADQLFSVVRPGEEQDNDEEEPADET
jgi:hypothetical protein